jgi:hypothetical protein
LSKIELPSDELAEELQRYLQGKNFTGATYERTKRSIQFPDDMNPSQWANARSAVEKWAKGKHLELVESLKIQAPKTVATHEKTDSKQQEEELKKRLEGMTPEKAEERYNYLHSRPISELTDAEYDERLALAQKLSERPKPQKQ